MRKLFFANGGGHSGGSQGGESSGKGGGLEGIRGYKVTPNIEKKANSQKTRKKRRNINH